MFAFPAPSPSPFSALSGTGTTKVWLACGAADMRKGFDGLAVLVQQVLEQSPHSGALFAFRGIWACCKLALSVSAARG
jgi:transposase